MSDEKPTNFTTQFNGFGRRQSRALREKLEQLFRESAIHGEPASVKVKGQAYCPKCKCGECKEKRG